MIKLWKHFKTITTHKFYVCKYCFQCGLYKQGLLHDLSKYSWTEFFRGVKYFQGNRSPIDKEKEIFGYSEAWLHHKGRNRHHWEYWIDFNKNGIIYLEMPLNYVIESFCDRVAATVVYKKKEYTNASAYEFFMQSKAKDFMHPKTGALIEMLLLHLKEHGLQATTKYIKHELLK